MGSSLSSWGATCAALVAGCSTPILSAPDAGGAADTGAADVTHPRDAKADTSHADASHPHADAGTRDAAHTHDAADAETHHDAATDVVSSTDAPADTSLASDTGAHDASADAHDAGDAGLCPVTSPTQNAPPITNAWLGGTGDAGARTDLQTLQVDGCYFTLFYTERAVMGPPVYAIWLEKASLSMIACESDKGIIPLGSSDGDVPTGALAANTTQKLVAATYSYKFGVSGQDYQTSALTQVDWAEGVVLRQGTFVVKGAPSTTMLPAVVAGGITVSDCDVTVTGQGTVASPTDAGTGSMFSATWVSFLAEAVQNSADATSTMSSN